ncbi:MAG: glutamine-hydrolyzing carbamoyl-phosphate synthase small subunit [Pseudomonadota bacterium]
MRAILALEDGRTFDCRSFTGAGETGGEVVFNTAMSGYQEVLTDPSYSGQMVTMTYPLMGNYGVNPEDVESGRVQVAAFIVKEYQPHYSNFRATQSLADYLSSQRVMGIEDLDTRALTLHLRTHGAMRGFMSTTVTGPEAAVARARQLPSMVGQDLVCRVTTDTAFLWKDGKPLPLAAGREALAADIWSAGDPRPRVVAFDFGIKFNILRLLENAGFAVLVVPATTSATDVKALAPDGIFLSNGPGDPEPVTYAIETVRALIGYRPIFGICLGVQLLGLALGGKTYKLKFGHRGINQPVKDLKTGRIEVTSQNHGFVVDIDSLAHEDVEITHVNLNDGTLEGFRHLKHPLFAVQHHPEAAPGPHDAAHLFDRFRRLVEDYR